MNDVIAETVSGQQSPCRKAEEDLYDLVEGEPVMQAVMAQHGITRDHLRSLFTTLMTSGAGQYEGGRFVPVFALSDPFALDYMHRNLHNYHASRDRVMWVCNHVVSYVFAGMNGALRDYPMP